MVQRVPPENKRKVTITDIGTVGLESGKKFEPERTHLRIPPSQKAADAKFQTSVRDAYREQTEKGGNMALNLHEQKGYLPQKLATRLRRLLDK